MVATASMWPTVLSPSGPDVAMLVVAIGAGALYALGVHRLTAKGRRWSRRRSLAFFLGLATLVVATSTGIGRYDDVLFSLHALQHVLLGMLAPLLLALGAPVTLGLRSGSPATRRAGHQVLRSPLVRAASRPGVAFAVFTMTLLVLYLTPLYELSLRHDPVHVGMHVHFVAAGFLFATAVVGLDAAPSPLAPVLRLLLVALTVPVHAVLGLTLLSAREPVAAGWYAAVPRPPWAGAPLADQRVGAGILWAAGELFGLVVALVVVARWMAQAERSARRQDLVLDAAASST